MVQRSLIKKCNQPHPHRIPPPCDFTPTLLPISFQEVGSNVCTQLNKHLDILATQELRGVMGV